MTKLILVRHGETDWNRENRIQGTLDIPLNNTGEKEARRISEELSALKIDAIYSSPVACCVSTANEIAERQNIKVKTLEEFIELNHGIWQGLLLKDIKKRYRKQYNAWKASPTSGRLPNGESTGEAYDRAINAVHRLRDNHRGENVCIVSHDVLLSLIKCHHKNADVEKLWEHLPGSCSWEALDT